MLVLGVIRNPGRQIDYGTGKNVNDEPIADAGAPLTITWFADSFIDLPARRSRTGDGATGDAPPGGAASAPGHEPLEAGVPAKRGEVGVDLEPAWRQVVWDLEQRLEKVERLLRLAGGDVDPDELVL